jgi:serine/threonine-protein kinase
MGLVFEAEHSLLGRRVAIKTIRPEVAGDADLWRRLLLEAKVLASLNHSSIVQLHDFFAVGPVAYVVMEYLPGSNLEERLADRKRLPVEEILAIVAPAAAALDHAHSRGIVHRDLKPSNILLTQDGRVMVMDFGLAKMEGNSMETDPNWMLGTPAYIAPEQMVDGTVDARTDVYAFSAMIFEAVAGRQPFVGESWIEVASKRLTEPPPLASDICAAVPPAFARVLERGMSKEAALRPSSVGQLVAELTESMRPAKNNSQTPIHLAVASVRRMIER